MSRDSIVGKFRDPANRPRYIMWTGVWLFVFAIFLVIIGGVVTSTRFFCAESCHGVQNDTIAAYRNSSHAQVSCVACHEPVNTDSVTYMLAKAKSVLTELPETATGAYRFPLNKGSAYALNVKEMPDKQCTQCHNENLRKVTPGSGIIIDHAVHTKNKVTCTTCHNRCAHNEVGLTLKLKNNVKHEDFLEMDACFRCHDLAGKRRAAGTCSGCHPSGFKLVPDTHEAAGWLPKGHAEAALESRTKFGEAKAEATDLIDEGVAADVAVPVEHCSTCHLESFCSDCHAQLAKNLVISKK
jgi:hypothetical protein